MSEDRIRELLATYARAHAAEANEWSNVFEVNQAIKGTPEWESMREQYYTKLFGVWRVTTEGDVEGRSTEHLGTFEGWIDEIALWLADRCYYSLNFKKIDPKKGKVGAPTRKSVNVTFDIDSGTWDMHSNRHEEVGKLFEAANRPVRIKPGIAYASFVIETDTETREEKMAKAKESLKSKMTAEELELLG